MHKDHEILSMISLLVLSACITVLEEEESFRDMERNSMQNSMEIQELRNCDLCARRFQTRKITECNTSQQN